MTTREPAILVGLDGSELAAEALDWAMAEAEHAGDAGEVVEVVEVVTVWRYFEPGAEPGVVAPHAGMAELAGLIDAQVAEAAKRHPGVRCRRRHLGGRPPGETLVDAADGAIMLVVGSHGVSGVLPALLGSVSAYCVRHARCPVAIFRRGMRRPAIAGRVVT